MGRRFCFVTILYMSVFIFQGCANDSQAVKGVTRPVKAAAEEIGKVRTIDQGGSTRAVLAPQEDRKLRIAF